ncbi:MAG: hypothetical protein R3331_01580 [Sulfurospirillaceae bacterium]|nr:hypothetical protein [Sulfurospirillaceae bacterium]
MNNLIPVIFISILIVFIMLKNIKKVTDTIDMQTLINPSQAYGDFSAHIQDYIRDIRADINKASQDEVIFSLKDMSKLDEAGEILSDFIRKLVFFETAMAKNRTKEQLESELAQILIDLDTFVKDFIQNGDIIAEKMREDLQTRFEELQA